MFRPGTFMAHCQNSFFATWQAGMASIMLCSLLLSGLGCANVALIGRPTLPPSAAFEEEQVTGRVVAVDPEAKVLYLRTADGAEKGVRYRDHTTVMREGREYLVESLRPGERITLRTVEGSTPTDLIIVQRTD